MEPFALQRVRPMAANESSGLSFYPRGHESAGPPPPGFAVVLRFVTPRFNSLPHATFACATRVYFEMVSSAMPFVRGPMNPIAAITIAIAPAMNANTPNVPKPFSTAAITNDEKIAEKRLHE